MNNTEYGYKLEKVRKTWYVVRTYSDGHTEAECGFSTKKVAKEAMDLRLEAMAKRLQK